MKITIEGTLNEVRHVAALIGQETEPEQMPEVPGVLLDPAASDEPEQVPEVPEVPTDPAASDKLPFEMPGGGYNVPKWDVYRVALAAMPGSVHDRYAAIKGAVRHVYAGRSWRAVVDGLCFDLHLYADRNEQLRNSRIREFLARKSKVVSSAIYNRRKVYRENWRNSEKVAKILDSLAQFLENKAKIA